MLTAAELHSLASASYGARWQLPGGERLTDAELAQRRANAPLRPKVEQNLVCDHGLFGDSHLQAELFPPVKPRQQEKTAVKDEIGYVCYSSASANTLAHGKTADEARKTAMAFHKIDDEFLIVLQGPMTVCKNLNSYDLPPSSFLAVFRGRRTGPGTRWADAGNVRDLRKA